MEHYKSNLYSANKCLSKDNFRIYFLLFQYSITHIWESIECSSVSKNSHALKNAIVQNNYFLHMV